MRVIDNIFSEEELACIDEEVAQILVPPEKIGSTPQWRSNHYYWGANLNYAFEGHVLYFDCSEKVKDIVRTKIKETTNLTSKGSPITYSVWLGDSGAHWHPDGAVGFTFYLRPWPIENGGQLFYVDEHECQSMIPVKRNRLVINDNQTMHRVSRVRHVRDPRNNVRLTIQVFALE